MPSFNFKVEVVTKIGKRKSQYKYISKASIIHKNVNGVVHIRLNGQYYINTEYGEYAIHPDSLSTEGLKIIYPKRLLDGKRVFIHRDPYYGLPHINGYLPFSTGCLVIGNIVYNSVISIHFFKIKRVYEDTEGINEEAKEASRFYRVNYNVIFKNGNTGQGSI